MSRYLYYYFICVSYLYLPLLSFCLYICSKYQSTIKLYYCLRSPLVPMVSWGTVSPPWMISSHMLLSFLALKYFCYNLRILGICLIEWVLWCFCIVVAIIILWPYAQYKNTDILIVVVLAWKFFSFKNFAQEISLKTPKVHFRRIFF